MYIKYKKIKHTLGEYSMHNGILALTCTKTVPVATSDNVRWYVTLYMCYIM